MDIFIFQKLSEKTARIAEIWDSNGESNTFNLQEFNPSEIKSALISDPMVLAELQLIEDKEKIDDDIRGLKNEQAGIDKITDAKSTFEAYFDNFDKWVAEYRPKKDESEVRSFSTLLGLANGIIKTQLDDKGHKMEYSYNRTNKPGVIYSDKSPASKPYYQDKLVLANRTLQKSEKEYLKPKGLTIESLPLYKESLNVRIKELEESKTKVTSEESIRLRADYIAAERAANKIESVGVVGRAKEFERLNYLLDDKVKKSDKKEAVAMSCPPVDENGKLRIDKEAIEHLSNLTGVEFNTDLVIISRDDNPNFAWSPDGYSKDLKKAAEVKCLRSAVHIQTIIENKIPDEYKEQSTQPFIACDELEILYFTFYDPRVASRPLHIIEVKRADIEKDIQFYKEYEAKIQLYVDSWVKELAW